MHSKRAIKGGRTTLLVMPPLDNYNTYNIHVDFLINNIVEKSDFFFFKSLSELYTVRVTTKALSRSITYIYP
jgi:hypothetical protein